MLFKSESFSRSIPETSSFKGKLKFFLLKRYLGKTAEKYDVILDEVFYYELFKWTGKRPMITFCKEGDSPGKYLLETKEENLQRIIREFKESRSSES
ncbi:MAG TPA: hypothetical protein PKI00_02500 [Candidatus Pacearchaeota archaeon]|nr:hypothetical protein [Candidatus Parcubacteria bacterium]HNP79694.1 hypothetical protein [Candidatus Pacearchaeota archaeon]HOC53720.1 hypothetical protein [Candidatus Pacearchaeota archaeon]HQM24740.1 hypothetical protein [Candidatus Pacearchaeota archaeon]